MYEFLAVTSVAALLGYTGPGYDGVHDWTGPYAGLQISNPVHGRNRWFDADGNMVNLRKAFSGLQGGAVLGFNYQRDRVVLGAEAEINHGRLRSRAVRDNPSNCAAGCQTEFDTIGALRARIGYAYQNNLLYAHAGWAVARSRSQQFGDYPGSPAFDISGTVHGHTWGYGIEHALNDRVSVRLNYSHMVYNRISDDAGNERARSRFGNMSIGVNYRF